MSASLPPGLMGITDPRWGDPVQQGRELAQAGCRCVQLRAKSWSMKRLENAAHQLLLSLRQTQTLLIINDHIDIAKRVGADGVHLGQDDMGCHEARLRLGPNSVIGVSTHNLSEIDKAIADGANYVGFGPVFPTDTKTDTHLVQGVQQLRDAVAQSSIPVIAIGGITVANVQQVQAAGAFGWAVISDLFENGDPSAIVEKFSQSALSFRGTSE